MAIKVQRNVFQSIDSACVYRGFFFLGFAVILFTVSELSTKYGSQLMDFLMFLLRQEQP